MLTHTHTHILTHKHAHDTHMHTSLTDAFFFFLFALRNFPKWTLPFRFFTRTGKKVRTDFVRKIFVTSRTHTKILLFVFKVELKTLGSVDEWSVANCTGRSPQFTTGNFIIEFWSQSPFPVLIPSLLTPDNSDQQTLGNRFFYHRSEDLNLELQDV